MKAHVNFYETLKEAHIRLNGTIVLYDQTPYYVVAITNHAKDGIFRIYLAPLYQRLKDGEGSPPWPNVDGLPRDHPSVGPYMDKFIEDNPRAGILRKQMNSPLFNRYRPFPLGMCNYGSKAVYLERSPTRKTEQGLIPSMLTEAPVTLTPQEEPMLRGRCRVDVMSETMHKCITADHPSAKVCVDNLLSGEYQNDSVAFHRDFAIAKGPIGTLFLAYKTDIIGVLPDNSLQHLKLGRDFQHCREACLDLNLFATID